MAIIIYIVLERTRYGTSIYAIGSNPVAAKVSGINVPLCTGIGYVIAGACTGVAAVVLTSRMLSGNPSVGNAYEMDAITCVILGGASFSGGTGKGYQYCFWRINLGHSCKRDDHVADRLQYAEHCQGRCYRCCSILGCPQAQSLILFQAEKFRNCRFFITIRI